MTILTATSVAQTNTERWRASLYAALAAAVVSLLMVLLKGVPVVGPLLGIVIGAAPIVGYDFARGALGESWRPVIAGLIGNVFFVIGFYPGLFVEDIGFFAVGLLVSILTTILWPIVVGAMSPNQSIWKLLLSSIIGLILGLVAYFAAAGQDPTSWLGISTILFWAVWGGTVGAALSAWSK